MAGCCPDTRRLLKFRPASANQTCQGQQATPCCRSRFPEAAAHRLPGRTFTRRGAQLRDRYIFACCSSGRGSPLAASCASLAK
jgi:hypothetical protein